MKTSQKNQILALFALVLIFSSCSQKENKNISNNIYDQIQGFVMPVVAEASFPDNTVSITDFGAVSDGQTLNTKAIADAIDDISKKGGGKVVIPRGLWLTGPIILKSNINLCAEEGALVIFSKDKAHYPLIETNYEGSSAIRCTSPITGRDLENIALTGKGIFDGSGEVWRPVKKEKMTESQWNNLLKSGGVVDEQGKIWYPSTGYMEIRNLRRMNSSDQNVNLEAYEKIKDVFRPVMVSLVNCKKVLLDGPVFQNSPAWCLHPLLCEDLIIRNVTVKNPWFSQNGDGLDIESCKNVLLYDSSFDVGDDGICIKSGKDAEGRKRGRPTENLIIKNCVVYHGHGGITVGSEMSGGVKNVFASECTFIGTDVGLRFKSNRGRGGVVENIYFTDIDMINIPTQAISFNLYYGGNEGGGDLVEEEVIPPVTEETPAFRNITIRNVTCKGARDAVFLQGLPEMNLQNITLENIYIEADNGITCVDADGIHADGIRLITKNSPAINISNCSNIDIKKLEMMNDGHPLVSVNGKRTKSININTVAHINDEDVIISGGTKKEDVKVQ